MKKEPCAQKKQVIRVSELPLCCPMPNQRLWDGHPRVYLPIETMGSVDCPYCETHYFLDDPVNAHS